jgi:hypothetical protein
MVPGSGSHGTSTDLPDHVVTDLLGDARRRIALSYLAERDGPVALDDLAAVVRAREQNTTPKTVPECERRAVREEFFETHLPKLTATDVVEYDSMIATVALADDRILTHVS